MIWLWIAAALLSAGVAMLMAGRAARAAGAAADNPALAVYRRQMAEVDELAERGLIAEADRRGVRAETGRRLLAAADRHEPSPNASRPWVVMALAAATPLLALALYLAIGVPGLSDQPFARRLKAWEATASTRPQDLDAGQLAAVWRDVAAAHPADPVPLRELGQAELAAGQPSEAAQAIHRALALAPGRADLWDTLGLITTEANQGEAGPDALADFRRALALDPNDVAARYYLARERIAGGDVAGGLADWRAIGAGLASDDPRRAQLESDIRQVAATGGLGAPAPEQAGGVGQAQIQAMVDGLAQRLKAQPDDPQGWVRLVRAYAVLGETDRRDAALAEARRRYAGRSDILSQLNEVASPPR
jgi:cytochrome c-type biogenesis protein CcmH